LIVNTAYFQTASSHLLLSHWLSAGGGCGVLLRQAAKNSNENSNMQVKTLVMVAPDRVIISGNQA
jgi:hypothetical protein